MQHRDIQWRMCVCVLQRKPLSHIGPVLQTGSPRLCSAAFTKEPRRNLREHPDVRSLVLLHGWCCMMSWNPTESLNVLCHGCSCSNHPRCICLSFIFRPVRSVRWAAAVRGHLSCVRALHKDQEKARWGVLRMQLQLCVSFPVPAIKNLHKKKWRVKRKTPEMFIMLINLRSFMLFESYQTYFPNNPGIMCHCLKEWGQHVSPTWIENRKR